MAWTDEAECAHYDPELWFPTGAGRTKPDWSEPRAICDVCPVKAQCLEAALRSGEREGMFGGLTPEQRRRLKGKPARDLQPIQHGTDAGDKAHRRRGEKSCEPCRRAASIAREMRKTNARRTA